MLALAVALLILGVLFRAESLAAIRIWRSSTAYNHCILVLPIALYIAWDLRANLKGLAPQPLPLPALLAIPLMLIWLFAHQLGLMEGRQLIALAMVELLFFCVLGWRLWRALAPALLYLVFLVPFGAFLTVPLQSFTASFVAVGLSVLHIPHYADAFVIEIPEGRFIVAEACAGLRFLIAAVAFSALYAIVLYRSPWRRLTFIAISMVVPVIANGLRCLGLVLLGHALGRADAVETDHILYGWLFFSIVLLILIVAGLPFREDRHERLSSAPAVAPAGGLQSVFAVTAAALLVVLAAAGPVAAHLLDGPALVHPRAIAADFAPPAGCSALPDGGASFVANMAQTVRRFACGAQLLTVTVDVFPPGSLADAVLAARRAVVVQDDDQDPSTSLFRLPGSGQPAWEIIQTAAPARCTATALWIRGRPASGNIRDRLAMAWDSIAGAAFSPVLIFAEAVPAPGAPPDPGKQKALLQAAIRAQPQLAAHIAAASRIQPEAMPAAEIARSGNDQVKP